MFQGACTSVKGSKKFKKSVASPKIDITGSLNDTVPDAIMTYFSDQVVPFPQKFRAVNFQNVSLKGLWNDVNVEKLNRFLVQIEQKGCCQGTLIIPKGFTLFIEHLNVTGWVNNDSIKEWNNYQGRNISLTRSPKFKLIKASKAIVNGSLNTNYNVSKFLF